MLVEHAIVLHVIACQTIINAKNNSSENDFAGLHIHIAKNSWHNTKETKSNEVLMYQKQTSNKAKRMLIKQKRI